MRVIIQRSKQAMVSVGDQVVGQIKQGLVLLVGITHQDTFEDVKVLSNKIAHLRIFDDNQSKMNLSILESGGEILSISQFTLYSDCRNGRRPNYMQAAKPEFAKPLYEAFNTYLSEEFGIRVETGRFGEMMDVHLTNWGPVTIVLDSQDLK